MSTSNERRWFHCIITTYGAWLPGDPRGFRTRHHREHVEGDYKHPPPKGLYDARFAESKRIQKFPTVTLSVAERELLGRECVRQFRLREMEAVSLAVCGQHLHFQLKCPKRDVIRTLGDLKRAMWFVRSQAGNRTRLWGRGRKIIPINTRSHQRGVLTYILDHRKEGAWVWCWRDGYDFLEQ